MGARNKPPIEHQFKKGVSGNPKGRPPKLPEIDALLANTLGTVKDNITAAQEILNNLKRIASLKSASQTSAAIRAAEVLFNRGYGTPKATLDVQSKGEALTGSLLVVHEPADDKQKD